MGAGANLTRTVSPEAIEVSIWLPDPGAVYRGPRPEHTLTDDLSSALALEPRWGLMNPAASEEHGWPSSGRASP